MSLDPCPSDAELLRMAAEREQRRRVPGGAKIIPYGPIAQVRPGVTMQAVIIDPDYPEITLRIPWSALCSDNVKMRAALKGGKATVVLTPNYRTSRDAIHALAVETMHGRPAADIPLRLVARVYVPDNRVHDVVNFSKAVHDALKGTVFTDDRWLYDARWIRAGVDVDAPRCELTISPLPETP